MDYKAVLQEQIRELQKAQDNLEKRCPGTADEACKIAHTILELIQVARNM